MHLSMVLSMFLRKVNMNSCVSSRIVIIKGGYHGHNIPLQHLSVSLRSPSPTGHKKATVVGLQLLWLIMCSIATVASLNMVGKHDSGRRDFV